MPTIIYQCEICGKQYDTSDKCYKCEGFHCKPIRVTIEFKAQNNDTEDIKKIFETISKNYNNPMMQIGQLGRYGW